MPTQIEQDILKELGIDQLPQDRQEEVLSVMTEAILKRMMLRLLEPLSEDQRKQLEDISAAGDSAKVSEFLAANIPNYEVLMKEEVEKFKQDMKVTVDALLA